MINMTVCIQHSVILILLVVIYKLVWCEGIPTGIRMKTAKKKTRSGYYVVL